MDPEDYDYTDDDSSAFSKDGDYDEVSSGGSSYKEYPISNSPDEGYTSSYEDTTWFSHNSRFVLVESDCVENVDFNSRNLSFTSCLLKFCSKYYDASLDFGDLNLSEWQRLTKYNKHDVEDAGRNTMFLHSLETLLRQYGKDTGEIRQKILHTVSLYFKVKLEVKIVKRLTTDYSQESGDEGICYLYEGANDKFNLILERNRRFHDPESRAQSLIEDLRESTTFENYFRKILEAETESFLIRKKYLEISDGLIPAQTMMQVFASVGISYDTCESSLCKQLMECEVGCKIPRQDGTQSMMAPPSVDSSKDLLKENSSLRFAYELKDMMQDELKSSIDIIFLNMRESKARNERAANMAIQDVTADMVHQTLADKLVKLRFDPKRNAGGGSRAYQVLRRAVFIHTLLAHMESRRPVSLSRILDYPQLLRNKNPKNFSFLLDNFEQNTIPKSLCTGKLQPESLQLVVRTLLDFVVPTLTEPEFDETCLKFEATHLYMSRCLLNPKFGKWLALFRERNADEEIVVQFVGLQSLTIDADLKKEVFHGLNLSIESKHIFVGENTNDQKSRSRMFTIDVSGLDGPQHSPKKPPNPTATGCVGTDGLHGFPGESSGHVLMVGKEDIVGYEYLHILCNGGKGADGQDAGDGTDGADGMDGRDGDRPDSYPTSGKMELWEGKLGCSGENGGSSGRFGLGGEGGFGGSKQIFKGANGMSEKGTDGESGLNGKSGKAGTGGKRGTHGVDRAYIAYSGVHSWEKVEGNPGEEKLILLHHDGWFYEGWTVEGRQKKPPPPNGNNGQRRDEQNMADVTAPRRRQNNMTQQSQEGMDETLEQNVNKKTGGNKVQECMEKLSSLRAKKAFSMEKIREIDELRNQADKDFKRMKQELMSSTLATRAQENFSVENRFSQQNLTPSEECEEEAKEEVVPLQPTSNEDIILGETEALHRTQYITDILMKAQSIQMLEAAEKFLKGFTFEKKEDWWNAAHFLKEGLSGLIDSFDETKVVKLHSAYHEMKNLKELRLPPLHRNYKMPDYVLIYLCDLVKMGSLDLNSVADVLLANKDLNLKQKESLLGLLAPFYVARYVSKLQEAIQKSKVDFRTRARDKAREAKGVFTGSSSSSSANEEDDIVSKVETILSWHLALPPGKKPSPTQVLNGVCESLRKNTDSTMTLDDLLEKYFSSKEVLDFTKEKASSLGKKTTEELLHDFSKFCFIIQNYSCQAKELDDFYNIYYTLKRKRNENFALILKGVIDAAFLARFQHPKLQVIFQALNLPLKEMNLKRKQLETMLNAMESFERRRQALDEIIGQIGKSDFDWTTSLKSIQEQNVLKDDVFKSTVDSIVEDLSTDKKEFDLKDVVPILRRIQFTIQFRDFDKFSNIYNTEILLIKLQDTLNLPKNRMKLPVEVVEGFSEAVNQFWIRLQKIYILDKLRDRFNFESYKEWKAKVMEDVQILLESNLVVDKASYSSYLELKLEQILHHSLRVGALRELESLQLHDEGDELDRLRSVLLRLDKVATHPGTDAAKSSYSFSTSSNDKSFENLLKAFNGLHSKHISTEELYNSCQNFCTLFQDVFQKIEKDKEADFVNFIREMEYQVVPKWENIYRLSQFQDSSSTLPVELSNLEKNQARGFFSTLTLKVVNKSQIFSKPSQAIIREWLKTLGLFVANDSKGIHDVFVKHFDQLGKEVNMALLCLEDTLMDHERLNRMISASLQTGVTTLSGYIDSWKEFTAPYDEILSKEQEYYRQTLQKTKDEWEMLGDSTSPPETQPFIVSENEQLKNIERKYSSKYTPISDVDPRLWPAITFSLELFKGLQIEEKQRRKFLDGCLTLTNFEDLCNLLKTNLSSHSDTIGIEGFVNPGSSNSLRKLVTKLITSELSEIDRARVLEAFTCSDVEIETKLFRSLLSSDEVEVFDKVFDPSSPPIFKIPKKIQGLMDWDVEFQTLHLEKLLKNLVARMDESGRDELENQINAILTKGGRSDNVDWMEQLSRIGMEFEIYSTSSHDFSQLLLIFSKQLPLQKFKQICSIHVPPNYLKYALVALIEDILSSKLEELEVKECMSKLDFLLLKEEKSVWEPFLKKLCQETSSIKFPHYILSIFNDVFDRSKLGDSESRTNIIMKWTELPWTKWNQQLRIAFYNNLIPNATEELVQLLIEVDDKFTLYTESFIVCVKLDQADLTSILQDILSKDWILDFTLLAEIQRTIPDKGKQPVGNISNILEKYKVNYDKKELEGTPLVDSIIQQNLANVPKEKQMELRGKLLSDIREVRKKFKDPSTLYHNEGKKIKEWSSSDIKNWILHAQKPKTFTKADLGDEANKRCEILAVIIRSMQIHKKSDKFVVRDTQLAAILFFIYAANEKRGRFGEIATSEGKTLISAVSALVLALTGNNIYIITSSAVLATDGFNAMHELFAMFGIGVGNVANQEARKGTDQSEKLLQKLYQNRVLYGDSGSFESDFLQCKYLDKNFKDGTDAQYLIVDEVDSLLLDKGSNVLYISHTIPELCSLRNIFLDIWARVLRDVDGVAIYRYIKMKYIQTKQPKFSHFLKQFVEQRVPVWINNAFVAQTMKQNIPYILADGDTGKVTIVDGDTGMEQKQTQYSYGLHQFLQLKEGNKISAESLKAVFVSNIGYFQQFQGRIFGISGTLGEDYAKKTLEDLYDVDFFKLPRCKKRKCIKEPPQFFKKSEELAYESAVLATILMRQEEQPLLFICETVKQCKNLYSLLKPKYDPAKLICIYESEKYDEFSKKMKEEAIQPGIVIISTNLAGRGTDIELSDKCEAKGLHVVLLYIPPNVRVEKQAFGRTARSGANGSTEYIVHLPDETSLDLDTHFKEMQDRESKRLDLVNRRQVPQIQLEEKLFKEFAGQLRKVKEHFMKVHTNHRKKDKKIVQTKLHIVKNRWAFWLDGIQSNLQMLHINPAKIQDTIWRKYRQFCKELDGIIQVNVDAKLCCSASDFLKLAHAYEERGEERDLEISLGLLVYGIKQEPDYNETLHYYMGVAILKKEEKEGNANFELRKLARASLKMASRKVSSRKDALSQNLTHFKATLEQFLKESKDKLPDFTHFQSQVDAERGLLSHHENMFLQPALGHEIDENSFKAIQFVNQEGAESNEIYEVLTANSNLMKPLRLSKKITKADAIDFHSLNLSTYEDELTDIFKRISQVNNKEFDRGQVAKCVLTKDAIMKALKSAKIQKSEKDFLENVEDYELLAIEFDDFRFTSTFSDEGTKCFQQHKTTIGKILGERPLGALRREEALILFKPFLSSDSEAMELIECLIKEKYFLVQNHFTAIIPTSVHELLRYSGEERKKLTGIPASLEKYNTILTTWLVAPDGKISPKIDTKTLNILLPACSQQESQAETDDVINNLIAAGILKRAKVKWSLYSWFGEEESRKEQITSILTRTSPDSTPSDSIIAKLRSIFKKYHAEEYEGLENREKSFTEHAAGFATRVMEFDTEGKSEEEKGFEKYLEQISNFLIESVGKTKTLPKIKVESSSLAACYTGSSSTPEEYYPMRDEGFDLIPVLKEKLPWWNTGAALVALFGILQIAAGVAVAVLSAGTLANVSMMLISEGGGDLIFAAHAGWQGSFSWKSYGVHKVFSVACSVATGGLGGITGGSWGTIIAMEVAEEVFKTTCKHVARYAAQAVGTALANMTIEKVLDWLRTKIFGLAKLVFMAWMGGNQIYAAAKRRLRASMNALYAASFRAGQVETSVLNAKAALGPSGTSEFAHTLGASMRRVASFYMARVTEKISSGLGQGIVSNLIKLMNMFGPILAKMAGIVSNPIQALATDYVNNLAAYYEREAAALEKKKKNYSFVQKSDEKQMTKFIEMNMANVDDEVVDSGLKMFQHEIAEPALKQMCARKFDSFLKGQSELFNNASPSSKYLEGLQEMSVPSTLTMNTRLGFDDRNKARNNIWDTEFISEKLGYIQDSEIFENIQENCKVAYNSGGEMIINFFLDRPSATSQLIWQAERYNVNFIRKIHL